MKEKETEKLKKFRKAIVKNSSAYIYTVQKYKRVEYCLKILETDLKGFSMSKNYEYLLATIPWLYDIKSFPKEMKKENYLKIQSLRYITKTYLLEHKQNKDYRYNYKILNKLLGKLEVLSLALSSSQESLHREEKEVLNYFIFEIKNLDFVKDIILNKPDQINCLDKDSLDLLLKIISAYILALKRHVQTTPFKHFDDLLYFDRVLSILIEHECKHFTMKELKIIYEVFARASKENIYRGSTKDKYVYFIEKYKTIFQEFMIQKIEKKSICYNKTLSQEELFYQYDIHKSFSLGTKQEAYNIYLNRLLNPLKPSERQVYTVDSEGSEELDDGFSLETDKEIYELGIHVSNPIFDIKKNSKILEEILKRVYSYYLYEKTIYLYPELLGKDIYSLKENTTRPVLSLYTKIDKIEKKMISLECRFENIKIIKNDTYDSCNRALYSLENNYYKETLEKIQEILPILNSSYKLDPMYSLVARKNPNITHTNITGSTTSEKMIESFMIFFNSSIANLAREKGIPFIYRNHVLDKLYQKDCDYYLERLNSEKGRGFYTEELNMLKFRYPKSYYDTFSKGHAGLGVKNYCHISSAARRAGDNLNLLMLEKYYFNEGEPKEKKRDYRKLKKYAEYFNEQEKNMKDFSKEYYTLVRRK